MKKSRILKKHIKNFNEAIDNDIAEIQGQIICNVPVIYAGQDLTLQEARNKIVELQGLKRHID